MEIQKCEYLENEKSFLHKIKKFDKKQWTEALRIATNLKARLSKKYS